MTASRRRPALLVPSVILGLSALGTAALASSPAAWAQHDKETQRACAAASDLKDPVVHPTAVLFDDTVGYDARLVTGTWKPAHMKGAKALMLCLFDRKTRRAVVQDAEVWRAAIAPAAPAAVKPPVKAPTKP